MARDDRGEVLCESAHIRLIRCGPWEYAERPSIDGIVGIVAVTPEGRLLLVEQYRVPVRARVVELPAGLAGDTPACRGEALADAARRELREETGYAAARLRLLVDGPPSAGMTSEVMHLFLAEELTRVAAGGGDASEAIQLHEIPLARVAGWLRDRRRQGVLTDLRIYTALFLLGVRQE